MTNDEMHDLIDQLDERQTAVISETLRLLCREMTPRRETCPRCGGGLRAIPCDLCRGTGTVSETVASHMDRMSRS